MLIKLIECYTNKELLINTDYITAMRTEGPQTTEIFLSDGRSEQVAHSMADIVTIIENGGNIYD